jgi:hypothetical protein
MEHDCSFTAQSTISTNVQKDFCKKLLENLKCTYVINGSDDFSDWFKKNKFNTQEVEYASFDIVKLYPSVDTGLLLEFLIKMIYCDNRHIKCFRDIGMKMEISLAAILSKLTSFKCIDKFYRQRSGLPMGDSCSPKLANFYLHVLERDKIGDLIKNGTILGYKRFLDDTFVVYKKGYSEIIQSTFSALHESLEITMEKPGPNGLVFLDFCIYEKNGQL